ncbi:hypothetical protein RN001_001218 [Aquatica leii]|uniref:ZP domain-containing protein n=1 Tax=Aquatica leii TaxID=1421715 RepID=A0AAN7Q7Q7_9COLE|nr:hypothetical protein RN001_001218 [Aquatica leii]
MIYCSIQFLFVTWYAVQAAFTPDLPQPRLSAINKIADVSATCDSSSINITVLMENPFRGLLFTKDFPHECHATESLSYSLSLHLPTSGCGIRLNSRMVSNVEEFFYEATLVIQQDRYLQQVTDLEYIVKCVLQNNDFVVKSKPMVDAVKKIIRQKYKKDVRSGRMGPSFKQSEYLPENYLSQEVIDTLSAAKAWMEIIPEQKSDHPGVLEVGEPTLLIVKSTLPVGIGWKVVDCAAHDGLGDSSQKLLDEKGCPIDELLLAAPLMGPPKPIAQMRHQEVVSKFSAFKFPDRDRLHLSCGLQICKGNCEKVNCTHESITNLANDHRLARTLSKHGEVIDRFEVFNSVEVIAPGIEIDEFRNEKKDKVNDLLISPFGRLPGDKTFCVSSDKMAITFALLGLIFLFAVIVAVAALMKARRSGSNLSYYSKSLFSSTSSDSRFGGSKLLLHECPSIRQSIARGVPYGRVF